MSAFLVNGQVWRVVRVPVGDTRLVDRTGTPKLATTDPTARVVCMRDDLVPPLLDQVAMHEAAHVVATAHGELPAMRAQVPARYWMPVEEWAAGVMERRGIEASHIASEMLGRPACVRGFCNG